MVGPDTDLASLNLNWGEKDLPERIRTKHVHRLHPYLGKFVPQLVEVFLRKYRPETVCDPFVGSGTTLVEATCLGIGAVGVDVSPFNCLLSKVKTSNYDVDVLRAEANDILTKSDPKDYPLFGSPSDETDVRTVSEYLRTWYAPEALRALLLYARRIPQYRYSDVLQIVLCRSARSARMMPHHQLDRASQPQTEPYYCRKHRRICQPTTDSRKFLVRYTEDTVKRIAEYQEIRKPSQVTIICGDSRRVKLPKFDLVVTSPPYVGLIDYHEQHKYAYELAATLPDSFASIGWDEENLRANEPLEIGPASAGTSKAAKEAYRQGILKVFANVERFLVHGGRMVVVIGDRSNLYEGMAAELGLREEQELRRHVNRRTGRRNSDFFEKVFIWKKS
ncbi:MAG: class I SAM-dependent methyltransferase [Planctomycetes bacterium]|nr:class I SAM-dependent methyltransferase [Planctomycetota bacterium]